MFPIPLLQNTISSQNRLLQERGVAKYHEQPSELNRLFMHTNDRTAAKESPTFFLDPWECYNLFPWEKSRAEVTFLRASNYF